MASICRVHSDHIELRDGVPGGIGGIRGKLFRYHRKLLCQHAICHRILPQYITGGAGFGYALRKVVWKWKWDVSYPWLFRYKNEWLYALMGRDVPVPSEYPGARVYVRVEALTNIPLQDEPAKTRLYRGIVEGFTTEDNSTLRDLFLTEVERGKFNKEPAKDPEFYWKPVTPGNLMVLKYSELQNLNITYLMEVPPPSSPREKTASTQSSRSG